MKECRRCEIELPESEFTTDLSREGGFSVWCRGCWKTYRSESSGPKPKDWKKKTADKVAYARAYRKANPDKYRRTPEQERAIYERKMRRLHGDDWAPKKPLTDEQREASRKRHNRQGHEGKKKRRKVDPVLALKVNARKRLNMAVTRGKIIRQPCSVCGAEPAHGHHEDYSKPLEVVWLCDVHHREVHGDASRL